MLLTATQTTKKGASSANSIWRRLTTRSVIALALKFKLGPLTPLQGCKSDCHAIAATCAGQVKVLVSERSRLLRLDM